MPYLGICLGLQLAVIEIARNVSDLERGANSTEFDPDTPHPIVTLTPASKWTATRAAACVWAIGVPC